MDKEQLRVHFKKLRELVPDKDNSLNTVFKKLLENTHFLNAKVILLYVNTKDEVSSLELLNYCWEQKKKVLLPFIKEVKIGEASSFDDLEEVIIGETLYKQPRIISEVKEIDLAIIPALAYDTHGTRLGSGSGWYDRFFEAVKVNYKIGICFKGQLTENLPREPHDIKVDEVITD